MIPLWNGDEKNIKTETWFHFTPVQWNHVFRCYFSPPIVQRNRDSIVYFFYPLKTKWNHIFIVHEKWKKMLKFLPLRVAMKRNERETWRGMHERERKTETCERKEFRAQRKRKIRGRRREWDVWEEWGGKGGVRRMEKREGGGEGGWRKWQFGLFSLLFKSGSVNRNMVVGTIIPLSWQWWRPQVGLENGVNANVEAFHGPSTGVKLMNRVTHFVVAFHLGGQDTRLNRACLIFSRESQIGKSI